MQNRLETSPYLNLSCKAGLTFDYETNNMKVEVNDDINSKIYYFDNCSKTYKVLNYHNFNDTLNFVPKIEGSTLYKASLLKRLVSKKKKRFQTDEFDLDLAVLAMGYPATGCEVVYRNAISDVLRFFEKRHNNMVKVYNLCIEKDRIYDKNLFKGIPVGFFPSQDHNPCPVKLILEFCTDISLYLMKNPEGVAAIHCKAGKGRTGVMICCYLIFSGLCKNTEEALLLYADRRTINKKGVTIPSQIRYIQYFETFLMTNFAPPYKNMVPKIVKYYINVNTSNMIANYIRDLSYFITPNSFYINKIRIGPFTTDKNLNVKVQDFLQTNFKEKIQDLRYVEKTPSIDGKDLFYYVIEFKTKFAIKSDIKVAVNSFGVKFYFWCNLWYTALDLVKLFIDQIQMECLISRVPTHSVHPKLRLTSSMYQKKIKFNQKIGKSKFAGMEMKTFKDKSSTLTEELIDNVNASLPESQTSRNINFETSNPFEPNPIQVEKIEEHSSETKKEDENHSHIDKIYEIIDSLNNDTDLNILIDTINNIRSKDNKTTFNKQNLHMSFNGHEVDKFFQAKKMHPDFVVDLYFELISQGMN